MEQQIKQLAIAYIVLDEKLKGIREHQDDIAIGRYMEKYESGESKPIIVKKIGNDQYKLIDGHHRLEAIKKLKRNRIDAEIKDIPDEEEYSFAVKENLKHGVSLSLGEENAVLTELLLNQSKTQEQVAKIFGVTQQAIAKRIDKDQTLKKQLSSKIKVPTINEILNGKTHQEVANILKLVYILVYFVTPVFTRRNI